MNLYKMGHKKLTYLSLILLHIGIGVVLFMFPLLSKLYSVLIVAIGLAFIVKNKNRNNEVLYASAYIVGAEVILRSTDGVFVNEFGKYSVMLFMFAGMLYSGFSKNALAYWFYLLLLVPGIVISTTSLSLDADIKKAIFFNITGPVCIGIASIYCYRRYVSFEQLNLVLISLALPIISFITYLFLYAPSVKEVVKGTNSNFDTSGGFGPNQVSTILGLGIFLFFALMLLYSKSKKMIIIHLALTCIVAFRGIVTFSRGGVYTGIAMILLLLMVVFRNANAVAKVKIASITVIAVFLSLGIWAYSSYQTSGLIDKRYANEDARGRVKEDRLGGREQIAKSELQMFWDNPLLGIGVGKNKEYRKETIGINAASHNEITRLLAEHGSLGLLSFLILFATPLILSIDNRQHLYLYCFFTFWLLTINHAAMRIAAPAFIYSLSLLKVMPFEKSTVYREQVV